MFKFPVLHEKVRFISLMCQSLAELLFVAFIMRDYCNYYGNLYFITTYSAL